MKPFYAVIAFLLIAAICYGGITTGPNSGGGVQVAAGTAITTSTNGNVVTVNATPGSFNGNAGQFGTDGAGANVIKSGALLTNTSLTTPTIIGEINGGGFAIRDITAADGETGLPPYTDVPTVHSQWGFTHNNAIMALVQGTISGGLAWTNALSLELTGPLIINDQVTNSPDFGSNPSLTISGNSNLKYLGTSGPSGSEQGISVYNSSPYQQQAYCVSGIISGTGTNLVRSSIVDIAYNSASSYMLGTGLGVTFQNAVDALQLQLNSGHSVYWLTTVDNGISGGGTRGVRSILGYDNISHHGVWHWGADLENNGTWSDSGYVDAMSLDTKTPTWTFGTNGFHSQHGDFKMIAQGIVNSTAGAYLQISTATNLWSIVSENSSSDPVFGAVAGILAFTDFTGTFTHATAWMDSRTGTLGFGRFLTNDVAGDIGNSGTLHQTGDAFFGGNISGNGAGLTNIIATNGAYNGVALSSSVATTLVYTNNSGTTKRFLLCGEDDITTAATTGTLTVQVTWTNLVGQSTFTPLASQNTASKIALPFAPTILVVSNTTSVTISTTQVNTSGTATHTLQVALMPW